MIIEQVGRRDPQAFLRNTCSGHGIGRIPGQQRFAFQLGPSSRSREPKRRCPFFTNLYKVFLGTEGRWWRSIFHHDNRWRLFAFDAKITSTQRDVRTPTEGTARRFTGKIVRSRGREVSTQLIKLRRKCRLHGEGGAPASLWRTMDIIKYAAAACGELPRCRRRGERRSRSRMR